MPQKVIEIPGYGEVEFPDSMTEDQVNQAAAKLYRESQPKTPNPLPASQSPEFQLLTGASPVDLFKRLQGAGRAVGRTALGAAQWAQDIPRQVSEAVTGETLPSRVTPTPIALEPSPDPNQRVGEMVGEGVISGAPLAATGGASMPIQAAASSMVGGAQAGVPGAAVGGAAPVVARGAMATWRRLRDSIPSAARAGANFQRVMQQAENVPVDTGGAQVAADRARELTARGAGSAPSPIRAFQRRQTPVTARFGGQRVQMTPDPMTYREGFDFASNAGRVSADAAMKASPAMKAQLNEFAAAMKSANREAAAKVGMGEIYDAAMKEYRQAKTIEEAAEIIQKWGVRALVGTGIGLAGAKIIGATD